MNQTAMLLLPVCIQVGLTFALLFWTGRARVGAVKRGEVRLKDMALGQQVWPAKITQIANAYANQFQLPVLFYLLVVLVLVVQKVDVALVGAAWIFVGSRLVHAYVHVTTNNVPARFRAFAFGVLVLAAAWLWFIVLVVRDAA
jgi:hypothetical protein